MATPADTPDVLKRIVARKTQAVAARRAQVSESALHEQIAHAPTPRGFRAQMDARINAGRPAVIAEIKKASPSKGVLREAFDPAAIAASYADGGAACLSVLTEEDFFLGQDEHLRQARAACTLPVIRKDFLFDPYQVIEARVLGADCVLLIVAMLSDEQLAELHTLAEQLGMDVLVEVHDEAELDRALALNASLIGINNRDLRTFETDLQTCVRLAARVPASIRLVGESGIHTANEVAALRDQGIEAFLVGEAFMRADAPGAKLAELFAR
ncbi:MAG: indole-3-glycerol phosphate synthase TrpC [Spiribacter sp.]|nr:indole-3-glycerol phosphate synthase TrpC [Spiribacter sp.]MDR9480750.1 indole-3-glycerol phosphate synthase TrpC [Spiribacter sp.]